VDGADDTSGSVPLVTAAAEPTHKRQAVSAEDLAWEGQGRQASLPSSDVPVLRVDGFEGPLDWLLEQVRAGRVDLARLPVLALIEQCVAAIEAALARRPGPEDGKDSAGSIAAAPVSLQRLADWVVMAAWLAWLRSRLLLPEDDPEAAAARAEAEMLRRQLADRARVRDAAAWLDAQPQLGRDVFARDGGVPMRGSAAERVADLPALLRTYARLMGPLPQEQKGVLGSNPRNFRSRSSSGAYGDFRTTRVPQPCSVLPEAAEAIRGELSVEDGMLDVLMPEIVLDGAGVLAVVGELEAGRMPEHVRVDWHAQLGRLAGAGDQLAEVCGGHRRAALGDEDIGGLRIVA